MFSGQQESVNAFMSAAGETVHSPLPFLADVAQLYVHYQAHQSRLQSWMKKKRLRSSHRLGHVCFMKTRKEKIQDRMTHKAKSAKNSSLIKRTGRITTKTRRTVVLVLRSAASENNQLHISTVHEYHNISFTGLNLQ